MNTKSRNIIIIVGALVAGYVAGIIVDVPKTTGNLSSGDIFKVSKYHKNAVDSKEISALEEKLKSDTLAFNEELLTVGLINSRMSDFATLVDFSIVAAADKEEFCEEINSLINVRELSENAIQASKVASASLEYISSGVANELATDYEHASQNMIISFLMVDRQVQLGKQFVDIADKYLENNSKEDSPEIALARDLWAKYCAESAYLNDDKKELAYWDGQKLLCNMDMLGLVQIIIPQHFTKFESTNFANKIDIKELSSKLDQDKLSAMWSIVHAINNSNAFIEAKASEQRLVSKIEAAELAHNISQKVLACEILKVDIFASLILQPPKYRDLYGFLNSNHFSNWYYAPVRPIALHAHGDCPID